MGMSITVSNKWHGVGQPQIAMHLQLRHFLVIIAVTKIASFTSVNLSDANL